MKILIAEDTEDSRVMLEMALTSQGYEVMSSSNGIEALHLARTTAPDLIISDALMPEMDGFELCRQVKADPELKKIPFIFYTATYTDREDEDLALKLGASHYILKPLDPQVFLPIIKEVLASSQTEQATQQQESLIDDPSIDGLHLHSVSKKLDKKIKELEKERTALKKSEEKYRQLVESVQGYYFFYTQSTEGNFTYVSPSIQIVLGYQADDFLTHHFEYLTNNTANEEIKRRFELSINGEEQAPYEIEMYHKDGSVRWLEVKEIPVFENGGKVSFVKGIAHDITERRQSDEVMRRSQKMDALGKLTGGVAHDYNNMLGVILGYAELLENALNEHPKLENYAREIHRAAERGSKLTKKLLAFSRLKTSDAEVLNINELLNEERNMLEKSLTARIQLDLNLEDDLWMAWLDSSDLEDTILNLSINAMQAMDSNGQLCIETTNTHIDNINGQLLDLTPGDYIMLSFTDTGCGIEKETQERIFDPFYSTKGENGYGLGLSQVYGFVERSGGTIKVYSEPQHGTRFSLYFPRYIGNDIENTKLASTNSIDFGGKETILVVDDEPALLSLTTAILQQQGYNVQCAANGAQALEVLEQESIDLLLSDVIMPVMDGHELTAIVQKKYPHVKIQLASGFSGNSNVKLIDDTLHKNLLHKPYDSQELLKRIHELLG